jgi:hypothetical protein
MIPFQWELCRELAETISGRERRSVLYLVADLFSRET